MAMLQRRGCELINDAIPSWRNRRGRAPGRASNAPGDQAGASGQLIVREGEAGGAGPHRRQLQLLVGAGGRVKVVARHLAAGPAAREGARGGGSGERKQRWERQAPPARRRHAHAPCCWLWLRTPHPGMHLLMAR